jgi:hypothetical protein
MNGMMDVVLYIIAPAGLILAAYAIWLAHQVDAADARRERASHDAAHHPAE